MWSLDNFGDKAICLIHDGPVFEWNSSASNATVTTRATIISGAPTASRHMVVSTPDRHLVFLWNRNNYWRYQELKMICLLDSRTKKI
jgi:hypothetical protein